jgi:hypothetical protein
MKNWIPYLLLILIINSCNQQTVQHQPLQLDSSLRDFSIKWKADSLGLNSFRATNHSFDKDSHNWLIGGVDFLNYNQDDIFVILGKPNNLVYGKEDNLPIMIYIVGKGVTTPEKSILIYINKKNKVSHVIVEE